MGIQIEVKSRALNGLTVMAEVHASDEYDLYFASSGNALPASMVARFSADSGDVDALDREIRDSMYWDGWRDPVY